MRYRTRPRTAYLAARFDRKPELIKAESVLAEHNILPGTRWLHKETDMRVSTPEEVTGFAIMDVEDVLNADFLIAFSEELTHPWQYGEGNCCFATDDEEPDGTPHLFVPAVWARGGRHVEFGIALGAQMDIAVIGPQENIFHHYDVRQPWQIEDGVEPKIKHYETLEDFIQWYDESNLLPEDAEALRDPGPAPEDL